MAQYDSDKLAGALRAVLRPVADLMIASGVTLSSATELLKQALFDAAQTRDPDAVPISDSQISLLTGLHRKDVRRFREAGATRDRASFATASARLIAHWAQDARYVDAATGAPRALPRASRTDASFDGLVQDLRFDLAPGTILRHLLDMGLVDQRDDGTVMLLEQAYIPRPGDPAMLRAFEKNMAAHLAVAVDNVTGRATPPHFERASHFNKLSPASAAALETLARRLAEDQLRAFNAQASALQQQDKTLPTATHRVSFGSYILDKPVAKKDKGGS